MQIELVCIDTESVVKSRDVVIRIIIMLYRHMLNEQRMLVDRISVIIFILMKHVVNCGQY